VRFACLKDSGDEAGSANGFDISLIPAFSVILLRHLHLALESHSGCTNLVFCKVFGVFVINHEWCLKFAVGVNTLLELAIASPNLNSSLLYHLL
jgi:hypothetical protein